MTSWEKLRSLSADQRLILMQSLIILPLIALTLKMVGLQKTQRILGGLAGTRPMGRPISEPHLIAEIVHVLGHRLRIACLGQSVGLWWFLKRRAIISELCLGVIKDTDHFYAHAWVEVEGEALNEEPDLHDRFTLISSSAG